MSMKRVLKAGQALITAPSGGLISGQPYLIGSVFGIVGDDIAEGEEGYMDTKGSFGPYPFLGASGAAANSDAFWDPEDEGFYDAYATGRSKVGTFLKAVASGGTECFVTINGATAVNGESGDITGVVAGTGMTGGGVSGSVTLNVNIGTGAGQVAAGDHVHAAADVSFDDTETQLPNEPADVQAAVEELTTLFKGVNAAGIPYDHTTSGLMAENVQAAVDEVVSDIGDKADEAYTNPALEGVTTVAGALDAIVTRLVALEGA